MLRLLAAGDSNAEIARRLGITVHTVERHAANLYRKIGARGRADATAYACAAASPDGISVSANGRCHGCGRGRTRRRMAT